MKTATTQIPSVATAKPATLANWVNALLNALFSKVRNDTYIH